MHFQRLAASARERPLQRRSEVVKRTSSAGDTVYDRKRRASRVKEGRGWYGRVFESCSVLNCCKRHGGLRDCAARLFDSSRRLGCLSFLPKANNAKPYEQKSLPSPLAGFLLVTRPTLPICSSSVPGYSHNSRSRLSHLHARAPHSSFEYDPPHRIRSSYH
jgi:hypothetical protein